MGRIVRAFDDYNQAIEQDPNNAQAYNNRGTLYLKRKQYDIAIPEFDKALAILPDYARAIAGRAQAYIGAGKPERAVDEYTRLIARDPKSGAWFRGRGEAYIRAGKYSEALIDFNTAAAIFNLRPGTYTAKKDVIAAIGLLGEQAETIGDRGTAYLKLNQLNLAIADFDLALTQAGDDPVVLANRCQARGVLNRDLDKALNDCDRSLKLEANAAAALDSRGFVEFRMGKFAEALKDFDAALKLAPKLAPSLYMRGIVKQRLGDKMGGEADIDAAEKLDPSVAATYAKWGVMK
jgi:regulator of sirC expression with transglutaminase-like and TPR domain